MPRGFKSVRGASAAIQARRDAAGSGLPPALYFSIGDGETATVRFLEEGDGITWIWVHEVPIEGRQWGRQVPCLDQDDEDEPCPGCERQLKRSFKGFINVIWSNAPVYKRDKEGKLVKVDNEKIKVGEKDQVALLTSGVRLFENLDEIDSKYKGLRSRRFDIKRKGVKLNTQYVVSPEDVDSGKQPFTDEEKTLEADKYDLSEFTKIPSYDDFMTILNGGTPKGSQNGNDEDNRQKVKDSNPFMRNKS